MTTFTDNEIQELILKLSVVNREDLPLTRIERRAAQVKAIPDPDERERARHEFDKALVDATFRYYKSTGLV